jgi:phosphatidylserine/phosphatidylglycerophosphate/cardiolipin synthase-like enzyme
VSGALHAISTSALRDLADAANAGKLSAATLGVTLPNLLGIKNADAVRKDIALLIEMGFTGQQLAKLFRVLVLERERAQRLADRVELVWSGPEAAGNLSRHTSVVMNELFERAERSVLVSGYAIFQGKQVFASLAKRMLEVETLRVRLFLNVARTHQSVASGSQLLHSFASEFRNEQWPGPRLPEIFYDPRSIALGMGPKACLHAKCVVVDERYAFVTSANLTEAAQERNIEAGVVIDDRHLAKALVGQFESLVEAGALLRLAV